MPTPDQLANVPSPVDGDGSTSESNDDGSTSISWPDGTSRVNYADGSSMITYTDGAVLNLYRDGTRTLNDANGVALNPSTGQPVGGGDLPTPPDQGPDAILNALKGDERIANVTEALGLVQTLTEAIEGELDPAEWVKAWFEMVIQVIKALETEERGCYMRAWCYTALYSALDMGTPPEPGFQNSLQGPDQDALDKQNWDAGVTRATQQMGDGVNGVKLRNRILLRVAKDANQPNVTLDALWHAACEHTDDRQLAQAYDHLGWPDPTGA
jgi:hypothetical protein